MTAVNYVDGQSFSPQAYMAAGMLQKSGIAFFLADPSQPPEFIGVAPDVTDSNIRYAILGFLNSKQRFIFSLKQVKTLICRADEIKYSLGDSYGKAIEKAFRNARWALVMGAKPDQPAYTPRIAAEIAPSN